MFDPHTLHLAARIGHYLHWKRGGKAQEFLDRLEIFFAPIYRGGDLKEQLKYLLHPSQPQPLDEGLFKEIRKRFNPFQINQLLFFLDQITERQNPKPLEELVYLKDLYEKLLLEG